MLQIIEAGNSIPSSFIVDPSAEFEPGTIGELTVIANQVVMTVSCGIAPLGIIDDVKTRAFTNNSWNEVVIVPCVGVPGPGGTLVTPVDVAKELRKPNIVKNTFLTTVNCVLNEINGIITFVAGTPLNYDLLGTGSPNAIRTVVNYTYFIANIPGDDSTLGSGRVSIWWQRCFFRTTKFETNQNYPLRANLFVSERGILTTRMPSKKHPAIACVTAPPSPLGPFLEAMWY